MKNNSNSNSSSSNNNKFIIKIKIRVEWSVHGPLHPKVGGRLVKISNRVNPPLQKGQQSKLQLDSCNLTDRHPWKRAGHRPPA